MSSAYASIDIIGGLGNHLFMIAALLSYIKKSKKQPVFKYEEKLQDQFNLPRKTFWNTLFKNQFTVLPPDEYNKIQFNVYFEKNNHAYEDLPYDYNGNILFKGYYQSFKYIDDDMRNKMINYLYSNGDLMHAAYDKYNEIKQYFGKDTEDDDMVSVHMRRTDFIWLNTFNYNLGLDYYDKALKMANKKYIVIFSDDIEWCKQNVKHLGNIYFVDINNVEVEFLLMSLFQHNIIANSTFSLWASFISNYQKPKIVIAPKNWYGPTGPKQWDEIYHKYITHII